MEFMDWLVNSCAFFNMCFTQLILIMVWFNHLVLKRETHEICYPNFELMCFMLCLYVHIACNRELKCFGFVLWHYEFVCFFRSCCLGMGTCLRLGKLGFSAFDLIQEILSDFGDKCDGKLCNRPCY